MLFGEWGSGALKSDGSASSPYHRLLSAQDSSGCLDGHHAEVRELLVLMDHVPDAAEGGLHVLVDGGPHGL